MFTCGPCGGQHHEAATARACHAGETWRCGEQFEIHTEDGPGVGECDATARATDFGWTCERGHSYVDMQTRHREGWDYADSSYEAGLLAAQGVGARAMNGGAIAADPAAFNHVLSPWPGPIAS